MPFRSPLRRAGWRLLAMSSLLLAPACNKGSGSPAVLETESPTSEEGVYDPCAGKGCGDACTLCAPGDPDCMETAEVKGCSRDGECVSLSDGLCGGADAGSGGQPPSPEP